MISTEMSPGSDPDESSFMLGPRVRIHERDSFECEAYRDSSPAAGVREAMKRIVPAPFSARTRRRAYKEHFDSPRFISPPRRQRWTGNRYVRFAVWSPVYVLAFFGVVHLLRAYLGGGGFFASAPSEEDFWPDWGSEGQEGEFLARYPTDATRDVVPVPCHSHNDYWRRIPFYEAVHAGCTGVEADVWLKGGDEGGDELYVGHSIISLSRNRTFRNLYVNPILDMLEKQNPSTEFGSSAGHGVFDVDPDQTLVLLIDFKTDGEETWPVVREQLSPLRERNYLSHWNGTHTNYRAVTVVTTGNAPFDLITANDTYRDMFFDAPLDKLAPSSNLTVEKRGQGSGGTENARPEDFDISTSFYASVSLRHAVGEVSHGRFTDDQLEIIRGQIEDAHRQGLQARYWDTPFWPVGLRNYVWRTLMEEGADVLNVDDLKGATKGDWRRKTKHDIL